MISPANAEHYTCDGWYLVKNDQLTIIDERMPVGTGETRHGRARSHQVFYVFAGERTMEHDDHVTVLKPEKDSRSVRASTTGFRTSRDSRFV